MPGARRTLLHVDTFVLRTDSSSSLRCCRLRGCCLFVVNVSQTADPFLAHRARASAPEVLPKILHPRSCAQLDQFRVTEFEFDRRRLCTAQSNFSQSTNLAKTNAWSLHPTASAERSACLSGHTSASTWTGQRILAIPPGIFSAQNRLHPHTAQLLKHTLSPRWQQHSRTRKPRRAFQAQSLLASQPLAPQHRRRTMVPKHRSPRSPK